MLFPYAESERVTGWAPQGETDGVQPAASAALIKPADGDSRLLAIVGPTASGKSELAVFLARRLHGEVVNYDSVQLYRGFDIGSGKLPPAERFGIPHHLLDCLDPADTFTAGDFRREALRVLADLRARSKLPILVGGTGFYLRALTLGLFEGPSRSEPLRARLREMADRRGQEFLHRVLARLDPSAAGRIQPRDTQKLIRALEVCMLAKQPISRLQASGRPGLKGYAIIKVGLNPPRHELYDRINRRVESMFAAGLVEETRALLNQSRADSIKPLEALGYRQARKVLNGRLHPDEAVMETQLATRHYAKRQLTWFRREDGVTWLEGFGGDPELQRRVLAMVERLDAGRPAEMLVSNPPSCAVMNKS